MFHDLLLRRLFRTFGDTFPTCLAAGYSLAHRLHGTGRLDLTGVSHPSVVILTLFCQPGTALRPAVQAEYMSPGRPFMDDPAFTVRLAESLGPPPLQNLLLLYRNGNVWQQATAFARLRQCLLPRLCEFLSRLNLEAPDQTAPVADDMLAYVVPNHAQTPPHLNGLQSHLYRHLLDALDAEGLPSALPDPLPAWMSPHQMPPEEVAFLRRCLRLPPPDRVLVYLSFYADLTCREIHAIMPAPGLPLQQTIGRLRRAYAAVVG
jgi:hypothetical protein